MKEYSFLINGEWRTSERTLAVRSPYNGALAGTVYLASERDIEDALDASVTAFAEMHSAPTFKRVQWLENILVGLKNERDSLAELMTRESGKPITFARAEVDRAIFTFEIAVEEARRIGGEVLPLDLAIHSKSRIGIVKRFPIGPVAAITPFNFPLNLVAHKLAPAFAVGNPVILKPSSQAPLTAIAFAKIVHESGLPRGALNVIPCPSSEAEKIVTDERTKAVSFTGSPEVGWHLKSLAGRKRVLLELGGNAAAVIEPDADLDFAIYRLALGSFGNAGQSCIAVQRIYVAQEIFSTFLDRFVEETRRLKVGDPFDRETIVGPMISEEAARKVEGWIEEAIREGANLLLGGKRSGAMLEPTILTNTKPSMKVNAKEVFAPLVTIEPYDSFEEAIDRVNDSVYGLQAGVFTNDLRKIFYAYERLEVGGVIINDYPTYRIDHMPYGGVKLSGFGREGVRYAIEEMTEPKLLVLNLS